MNGIVYFRYIPHCGWMIFDWMPGKSFTPSSRQLLVLRNRDDKPVLIALSGYFIRPIRVGRFCKRPHRMMFWPSTITQRLAA